MYCEEFDLSMTITGIETTAKRKFVKSIKKQFKTKLFFNETRFQRVLQNEQVVWMDVDRHDQGKWSLEVFRWKQPAR